ncbi:MAG: hypothetical protein E4H38_05440 [Gemmatimonadales bacterium]|nr:MAG: hypothetical protein E4H38_05440 [Gemmatimonadales bacterium]
MAKMKTYRLDRVMVEQGEAFPAQWTFAGTSMSGTEQWYGVTDGNFPTRNKWEFVLRLPKAAGERIEVRPRSTPKLKVWEELTDRSLTFMRATMPAARGKRYCQVALADPTGQKTKDVIRTDERHLLPKWFEPISHRLRAKESVRRTKGTDGKALVVLVQDADHEMMIRLFFAMKVWVLKEKFSLPE